jgi:hypothetical protein
VAVGSQGQRLPAGFEGFPQIARFIASFEKASQNIQTLCLISAFSRTGIDRTPGQGDRSVQSLCFFCSLEQRAQAASQARKHHFPLSARGHGERCSF